MIIKPPAPIFPHTLPVMRFAAGADEMGTPRFAPPPNGAGNSNNGEGPAVKGLWRERASFIGEDAEARQGILQQMHSGIDIEHAVMLDLGHISSSTDADTRETQLEYLRGVMESVDRFSRSGMTLDPKEVMRTVLLIASAASDMADFISIKEVKHIPLSKCVSSMMRHVVSCADHLERRIIALGNMDRLTAENLARVYYSAAIKGSAGDAERKRSTSDLSDVIYKAHVANALLRLIDAQTRFARLGKTKEQSEVVKAITTLVIHHEVPEKGIPWAIGIAADFLRKNVDQMYVTQGKERGERHGMLVHNVRFFTYGNRQFAPTILLHCQNALSQKRDPAMHLRFLDWTRDEKELSDKLAHI